MTLPINLNFNNLTFGPNQTTRSLNAALEANPSLFTGVTFNSNPVVTNPMLTAPAFNGFNLPSLNMPMFSGFSGFSGLNNFFSSPSLSFAAFTSGNYATNFNMFPAFGQTSFSFATGTFGTNVRSSRVALTSDKARNAVQLAISEIGTAENGHSNNSAGVNKYRGGVANGQAWCASFVSWCYGQGQNSNNSKTFGYTASSQDIKQKAIKAGYYSTVESGYTPVAGDIAVWTNKGESAHGHVGIVSKVNPDGSFEVIEGNCGDKVQKVRRTRNTANLAGFVRMNEWLEA
ncbi:CHAP domain-containing protein [bacterium]|nr:CHAP domain-containing protein [bacterium]